MISFRFSSIINSMMLKSSDAIGSFLQAMTKKNNEINKDLLFLKQCCAQSSFPSNQGTLADFLFWHQQSNLIPSLSPPTPSYPLTQALILVGFAARPFAPLHNRQAARPNKTLFHSLFSWKRRNTGIFSLCRGFSHWIW